MRRGTPPLALLVAAAAGGTLQSCSHQPEDLAPLVQAVGDYVRAHTGLPAGDLIVDGRFERMGFAEPAVGLDSVLARRLGGVVGTVQEVITCDGGQRCRMVGVPAVVVTFEAPSVKGDTATVRLAWSTVLPGSSVLSEAYFAVEFVRVAGAWRFSRELDREMT